MDLLVVAAIGLTGSIHCVGMCGGFVVAITQIGGQGNLLVRQFAYYLGKTTTYVAFGLLAGTAGAVITNLLTDFQSVLSALVGVALIGLGLSLLGWLRFMRARFAVPGIRRLSAALGRLIGAGSPAAILGLGILNGLLPCALVYAMIVTAAATGSPMRGGVVMLVFGLATIPALVLTSSIAVLARPLWRHRMNQVGSVLVLLLGVLTLMRGLPLGDHVMHLPQESALEEQHRH